MSIASGIYQICNLITGKLYVGQAQDLNVRKYQHFWMLRKNIHENGHLQHSFNKYGKDNFRFEVLELVDADKMDEREQYYIDYYGIKNLYNMCPTAGSSRGYKHSDETKQKLSAASRGNQNGLGHKHSDETKHRMSVSRRGENSPSYGKQFSDEHKAKLSAAKRGKKLSDEAKKKISKPIKQIDKNTGEILQIFDGATQAARSLGWKNVSDIGQVAIGKRATAAGYKWEYV